MEISEIKINGLYRYGDHCLIRVWDINIDDGLVCTQLGTLDVKNFSPALPVDSVVLLDSRDGTHRHSVKVTEKIKGVFLDTTIKGCCTNTGELLEITMSEHKIIRVVYPKNEDYYVEAAPFDDTMAEYLSLCAIPYSMSAIRKICKTAESAKERLRSILSHSEFYNPETMCIDTVADIPNPSSERDASNAFHRILNSYQEEYPNDYKRLVRVYKFFNIEKFMDIKDNAEFKELGLHIASGMKPSRAINKFFQETGISRVSNYEKEYAKLSDFLVNNTVKRRITLSVNPIDYLRMSEGVSWTSCHNIRREGCYCNGVFSYMMDEQAMVLSLLDPNDEKPTYLQDKINRMMFFMNENGDILQSRLYPQVRIPAIEDFLADWVNDTLSKCLEVENLYQVAAENTRCSDYVTSDGVHYRDYACDGFGQRIFTQNGEEPSRFNIGHDSYCVLSGKVNTRTNCVVRSDASDQTRVSIYLDYCCPSSNDGFTDYDILSGRAKLNPADGKYYLEWHKCKDCGEIFFGRHIYCENHRDHHDVPICEECGEIIVGDVIEVDGKTYCEGCYDELFAECEVCGKIHRRDDMYEVDGDSGRFVCSECADDSEDYFFCEDCGDLCSVEDSTYIENFGMICEYCYDHGNYSYCDDCDRYYRDNEARYVESVSATICDDCFAENYGYCERCDEAHPNSDLTEVDGYMYCQWCIDNYASTCELCGELTFSPTEIDGTTICENCYENQTEECSECSTTHLRSNMTEVDGEWLCEDCVPEEEEETTESTPTQTPVVFDDGYEGMLTSSLDTFSEGTAVKVLHYDPATEQYTIQIDCDGREYYRTVERNKIA